ncbi:hypothetical protein [Deinococcus hopiensis]|uniref:Uncharacterized protein n=1 Tax=Deinococcus hopiensis KR-140 TaxID=695939 RepID=A0A1W1UXZ4_9DEIO|nr:hypothetical protein [Deinococcus hopiensis]SMB85850.1 hypothetical protein SAMN00790413_03566 [Deinococcus hopiensis KR-140]
MTDATLILLGLLLVLTGVLGTRLWSKDRTHLSATQYTALQLVQAGIRSHGLNALKSEHVESAHQAARVITRGKR